MNKKLLSALAVAAVALALNACSDASVDKALRWNNQASILCYSNGQVTLDDTSTGRVEINENGIGFYYRSAKTKGLVQVVRSDCVIREL